LRIPQALAAGDSISWDDNPTTDNLGNAIDSGTWTLKYDFRQSGVTNLSVTAAAQGTGWRTSLTAAESALWAAGIVYWQAYAVNGSQRVTLGSGQLEIKPNLVGSGASGAGEFRSQTEIDLASVQAAIRSIVSGGAKSYTINGRSMTKHDLGELMAWESTLKTRLAREKKAERIANGLGNPSSVFVRFR